MDLKKALARVLLGPGASQLNPNLNVPELQNSHGGSFMSGVINGIGNAVTLPRDVYQGKVDPLSDEGIGRAADMAGLAMTGGVGGAPAGAIGSGPFKAYHGSPHNFDRFDLSKIGTGEGAQAYGHGLYFAENEGVAQSYRDVLSAAKRDTRTEQEIMQAAGVPEKHMRALDQFIGPAADPRTAARDFAAWTGVPETPELRSAFEAVIAGKPKGRMYEVQINADPEHFLDWDKRIGEQDPAVIEALTRLQGRPPNPHDTVSKYSINSPSETADLAQAGIPGIKYLDQGSRGVGDGSRNYVVFNDQIVDILRKYGVASIAALPPAIQMAIALQQPAEQPQQ